MDWTFQSNPEFYKDLKIQSKSNSTVPKMKGSKYIKTRFKAMWLEFHISALSATNTIVPQVSDNQKEIHCTNYYTVCYWTRGQWPYIPASTRAIKVQLDFGSLWGYFDLRTASEIKSDIRLEFSDAKYLHSHVHIAYMVWAPLAASEAATSSKQPRRSNLTSVFQISDPIYLHIHVHIAEMVWALLAVSEATTASKQPRRSNMKSVTPSAYASMVT